MTSGAPARAASGRLRLGVLVSGRGTNLGAVLDAVAAGRLDADVAVVVSNVDGAGALARAEAAGVPAVVVPHGAYPTRAAFDAALVDVLAAHGVTCVVLAGFMRVVTRTLLDAFPDRVVNVHPSLLPAFPGAHARRDALAYGAKVSGCTVHLVDEGVDTGPVCAQAAVPVLEGDDDATLGARILREEHRLLPEVLGWIAAGRLVIVDAPGGRRRVQVQERGA